MTAQTGGFAFVPRRERWYERHFRFVVGAVAVLAAGGAWQACAALHLLNPSFTSSPSGVAVAEFHYFVHGSGLRDIKTTGKEFGIGLGLSIAIGVPLGLMMGYYRVVNALCEPIMNLLYVTPFIALAPLFVVWFGIGILSKLALILLAIVPIAMATAGGVKTVEGSLLNVARVYRASDLQIFRTLILPGTVPSVIAGIRLGTGFALIGAITAEFIASTSGVGYSINYDGYTELTGPLFAGVVLVSVAGLFFGSLVRVLERHIDRWRVR